MRDDPLRCPRCGVADKEAIEEEVPYPARRHYPGLKVVGDWDDKGLSQPIMLVKEVTHEAYFNSDEGPDGDTVYYCSECGHKFILAEVDEG